MWAGRGPTPGSKRRGAPILRPARGRRQGAHRADPSPSEECRSGRHRKKFVEKVRQDTSCPSLGAAKACSQGCAGHSPGRGNGRAPPTPPRPDKPVQTIAFGNRRVPLQQDTQIVFRLALVPAAGWAEDLPAARVISGQKLRAKQAPTGSMGHLSSLASREGERGRGGGAGRTPVEEGFDTGAREPKSTNAQLQRAS